MAAKVEDEDLNRVDWQPPKGKWTAEDARAGLEAARVARMAGESFTKFARRHGITESRLYWWKNHLAEKPRPMSILPVRVVNRGYVAKHKPMAKVGVAIAPATVDIVVDARTTVRVGKSFDGELLRSVIAALRTETC